MANQSENFRVVWQVPEVEAAAVSDGSGAHPPTVPVTGEKVLRNLNNVLDDLGAEVSIEVVAHGDGLSLVLAAYPAADLLTQAMARGIAFTACANTMARKGVKADDLVPGVQIVPAGIAHVIRRQQQGWGYVRG